MLTQSSPKQDRSALLENAMLPQIVPAAKWRVAHVKTMADFQLHVTFVDGLSGVVDMAQLVRSPNAGVFAHLAVPAHFAEATIEFGAVTWPGDIDLAPDAMYAAIEKDGIWRL